jgi:hypothetical protein
MPVKLGEIIEGKITSAKNNAVHDGINLANERLKGKAGGPGFDIKERVNADNIRFISGQRFDRQLLMKPKIKADWTVEVLFHFAFEVRKELAILGNGLHRILVNEDGHLEANVIQGKHREFTPQERGKLFGSNFNESFGGPCLINIRANAGAKSMKRAVLGAFLARDSKEGNQGCGEAQD